MTTTPVAPQTQLSELVAEEIRSWMGRRRITGARLARELGVSPAWVSYRLTGVQPIDLNDLQRIAGVLGVAVVELLPRPALVNPTSGATGSTAGAEVRATGRYLPVTVRSGPSDYPDRVSARRPHENRPPSHPKFPILPPKVAATAPTLARPVRRRRAA